MPPRPSRDDGPALGRPLGLSEVFAEAIRIYGDRVGAAFALGGLTAVVFILGALVHVALTIVLIAFLLTAGWAVATRIALGDAFGIAWRRTLEHAPALVVLTAVVTLPVAIALTEAVFVVFAVAWLAGIGFAVPVVVAETPPEELDALHRLGFALRRSLALARTEYFHAAGVIAALVLVYILVGFVVVQALRGFAENGDVAAVAIAQAVLSPFFFLGLAVLYFDQNARALSSRRKK